MTEKSLTAACALLFVAALKRISMTFGVKGIVQFAHG